MGSKDFVNLLCVDDVDRIRVCIRKRSHPYCTVMSDEMTVFDRQIVRARRDRAAPGFVDFDFLFREVADRLADRLLDIARAFPMALDLGCRTGILNDVLQGRGQIVTLIQCDLSETMAQEANGLSFVADEEALPLDAPHFDLVLSNLSLHWVNDLPGALMQANRCLKPDGLFLGAMLGGDTLHELRSCLLDAELEIRSGASPRLSPLAQVRDAGGLLQRAGFTLPVADSDTITVTYENAFRLMRDLRGMGETSAALTRPRHFTRRDIFFRAAELYQERHADNDGRIPATFEVIYLHGWAQHESQPRALRPGTARTRLADALNTTEITTDDKARPQ
jgi:NADH dehydrogenase [ubiquinone] 1 alpha subcomplex assembly factor 5